MNARIEWADGWQQQLDGEIERMMSDLGDEIFSDIKRDAPVDTGRLRNALYKETSGKTITIGWRGVEYGLFVEYGTSPHVIRPRFKKALHWPGALHPVAKVNHPGTREQAFMRRNVYKTRAVH